MSQPGLRFYSSEMGRWASRDPIGEFGGLNLLAFVANRTVDRGDYLGLLIESECLGQYLLEHGLTEDQFSESADKRTYGVVQGTTADGIALDTQVVWRMLKSSHTFKVADEEALDTHIEVRSSVVANARTATFAFNAEKKELSRVNEEYWNDSGHVKDGVSAADALRDLWASPDAYALGCYGGARNVMLKGILDVIGDARFNAIKRSDGVLKPKSLVRRREYAGPEDWIAGDWGWAFGWTFLYLGDGEWWALEADVNSRVTDTAPYSPEDHRTYPAEGLK